MKNNKKNYTFYILLLKVFINKILKIEIVQFLHSKQ